MMSMNSRNQYLQTIIKRHGYHLLTKKKRSLILDEFCANTDMNRKYIIRKIRTGKLYQDKSRSVLRKRKKHYDTYFVDVLTECWKIFDFPCGQRLASSLKKETDRLVKAHEIFCSLETQKKLKKISPRSIDIKLKKVKEELRINSKHGDYHNNPFLYQKIPVKLSDEWNRQQVGNIQVDIVEHCGSSARGYFINTVAFTDIATGWWEGEAIFGNSQKDTTLAIKNTRLRFPFSWLELHSDNGSPFINTFVYQYSLETNLNLSRSRPYMKNDNCFIEQKNHTHVRRMVGNYRYDTEQELLILNSLYRQLNLYKNYFQPVIKLISKERVSGHIKRKYDQPLTPYQRAMKSKQVNAKTKVFLRREYKSLNPAQLKREIDKKIKQLYNAYKSKQGQIATVEAIPIAKKLKPITVTFLTAQPEPISVT
jgi:hypothetical protein